MWNDLPEPVLRHLEEEILTPALVAWVRVDAEGRVAEVAGSSPEVLMRVVQGERVEDALPVLIAMLPLHGHALTLRSVEFDGSGPFDLHVFEDGASTWVLLLDEGERGRILRSLKQAANQEAINELRASPVAERLAEVARGLEVAVFEPLGGEKLRLVGPAPGWLEHHRAGLHPGDVLESRLISDYAADFLSCELEGGLPPGTAHKVSLPWTENVPGVGALSRECVVGITPTGLRFFLVRRLGVDLGGRIAPIQAGRDLGLVYERLVREIEEKDILLHGIFHDLANPLMNVISALELLEGMVHGEEAELRRVAFEEALRQQLVLRTMLDVFRAERNLDGEPTPETVELVDVVRGLEPGLEYNARLRGLGLQMELPATEILVAGDSIRLGRILQNLVENAFRVSPPGGRITIRVTATDGRAHLVVEDEGPGVSDADLSSIFDKLRRGARDGGSLGLGLYFCRLTARRWGGEVTQTNLQPQGCRFDVELVLRSRAERSADAPR